MRLPDMTKFNNINNSPEKYNIKTIDSIPDPPSRAIEFNNEKDKQKFIKTVEKKIRSSFEYKNMVSFLRSEMDMTKCSFFSNISNEENFNIKIEIHHSPFTLYDLCYIVLNKRIENNEPIGYNYTADEVSKLHYQGMVGLIPLSATVHALDHNGSIIIPVTLVFGNVQKFYDNYKSYMSQDQKELLQKKIQLGEHYNEIPDILKDSYQYLEIDGMKLPKVI